MSSGSCFATLNAHIYPHRCSRLPWRRTVCVTALSLFRLCARNLLCRAPFKSCRFIDPSMLIHTNIGLLRTPMNPSWLHFNHSPVLSQLPGRQCRNARCAACSSHNTSMSSSDGCSTAAANTDATATIAVVVAPAGIVELVS